MDHGDLRQFWLQRAVQCHGGRCLLDLPHRIGAWLFLINELDTPFNGFIVISSHAMRDALAHLSQ